MLASDSSSKNFLGSQSVVLWFTLAVIFILGIGIRLYDLTDPPSEFSTTRQNELYDRLYNHYPLVAEWEGYLLFNLTQPMTQ